MAKKVDLAEIEVAAGKAKHAKLLARYVKQEQGGALDLLEQCIAGGSKVIRAAAWPLLADLDVHRAERLALSAAEGAASAKKKEKPLLLAGLLAVASPVTLARYEELEGAVPLRELSAAGARTQPWLEQQYGEKRKTAGWVPEALDALGNAVPDFFRGLLDDSELHWSDRAQLVQYFLLREDLAVARRRDLTPTELEQGAVMLPPDECFDRLAPLVRENRSTLLSIAYKLGENADPRWVELYLSWMQRDPEVAEYGLCNLSSPAVVAPLLELASKRQWDQRLKDLLFALGRSGDVRAAPLLMKWLATAEGREAAPMLLTGLNGCGRDEDVPVIREAAKRSPELKGFYDTTIAHIVQRVQRPATS